MVNITKKQFEEYMIDVKCWDKLMVEEALTEMREQGTPIQEYLTQEDLSECEEYTTTGSLVLASANY